MTKARVEKLAVAIMIVGLSGDAAPVASKPSKRTLRAAHADMFCM